MGGCLLLFKGILSGSLFCVLLIIIPKSQQLFMLAEYYFLVSSCNLALEFLNSSICTGHTEAVLSVVFSPDGNNLASGSGDTTVRLWDLNTQTPLFTCSGKSYRSLQCFFNSCTPKS